MKFLLILFTGLLTALVPKEVEATATDVSLLFSCSIVKSFDVNAGGQIRSTADKNFKFVLSGSNLEKITFSSGYALVGSFEVLFLDSSYFPSTVSLRNITLSFLDEDENAAPVIEFEVDSGTFYHDSFNQFLYTVSSYGRTTVMAGKCLVG